jgi:hypothetical protein
MKEIKIVKLKDKYLINLEVYDSKKYLINGEELRETFLRGWYECSKEPKLLQEKKLIKLNERWELKNKDLYNETIPLVVDEHSKGKYKNLVESDLYTYTCDTGETLETIEFEVIERHEINDDIPYDNIEIITTKEGWYSELKTSYLIERVEYSLADNCLIPTPIKQLTCPCILPKNILYLVLTDYIKRNINSNFAKVENDYDYYFSVETVETKKTLIYWKNNSDKVCTLKDLHAKNFKELVKKIEKMRTEIIEYINQEHICEYCGGTGCKTKKLDIDKYFE